MVHAIRVKQTGRDSMCSFSKPYFMDRKKGGQSVYDPVNDDGNFESTYTIRKYVQYIVKVVYMIRNI